MGILEIEPTDTGALVEMRASSGRRGDKPKGGPATGSELARRSLTDREAEVLRQLGRGLSNLEIAEKLSITVGTTKGHLFRIYRKLDVRSRTAALAKARDRGLL